MHIVSFAVLMGRTAVDGHLRCSLRRGALRQRQRCASAVVHQGATAVCTPAVAASGVVGAVSQADMPFASAAEALCSGGGAARGRYSDAALLTGSAALLTRLISPARESARHHWKSYCDAEHGAQEPTRL